MRSSLRMQWAGCWSFSRAPGSQLQGCVIFLRGKLIASRHVEGARLRLTFAGEESAAGNRLLTIVSGQASSSINQDQRPRIEHVRSVVSCLSARHSD